MLSYIKKLVKGTKFEPSPEPKFCFFFASENEASHFFEDEKHKDINRLKVLELGFPELRLDHTPQSLQRFERFYVKNFVNRNSEIGISRTGVEELITFYVRSVLVKHGHGEWKIRMCQNHDGHYHHCIVLTNGIVNVRQFGWELSRAELLDNYNWLLQEYTYVASENH